MFDFATLRYQLSSDIVFCEDEIADILEDSTTPTQDIFIRREALRRAIACVNSDSSKPHLLSNVSR